MIKQKKNRSKFENKNTGSTSLYKINFQWRYKEQLFIFNKFNRKEWV